MPRAPLTLLLSLPLAAIPGCSTGDFNNEMPIGNTMLVETFSYDHVGWMQPPSGTHPDAPSLDARTLDRSNWGEYPFTQPVSGISHYPTYVTEPRYNRDTARAQGQFPTQDTVLQTTTKASFLQQLAEGIAAPVYAAADLALMPFRAVMAPPWSETITPVGPVHRVPAGPMTDAPPPPPEPTPPPAVPAPEDAPTPKPA